MEYENLYQDSPDGMPTAPVPMIQPEPPAGAKPPRRRGRFIAAAAAAVVLLGGGTALGVAMTGGAVASTGTNSAATTSSSTSATAAGHPGACARVAASLFLSGHTKAAVYLREACRSRLLRLALVGGLHGQITFKAKDGTTTLAFERGSVSAVTDSSVTVVSPDGTTETWEILSTTVTREAGQKVAAGTIAVGDQVLVAGPVVSGSYDARLIRIRTGSSSSSSSSSS